MSVEVPPSETPPDPVENHEPYQAAQRASKLGYVFFVGLLFFVAGVVWRQAESERGGVTTAWIFLSLVAMLAPLAWHAVDAWQAITTRRGAAFFNVAATVLLACVVLGFASWANIRFKDRIPSCDLTRNARYTLGDESHKLLDQVPGTLYATYLMQGRADEALRVDAMSQLRVFADSSRRVHVETVDAYRQPDKRDTLLKAQGAVTPKSGEEADVIVITYAEPGREVAPGRQKDLKVDEFTWRKKSFAGRDKWLGEREIASAIHELVFEKTKAYATGGHGEHAMSGDVRGLRDAVAAQNIEVVPDALDLTASPRVPDDCDVLFVLNPTAPFTPDEAGVIRTWLAKGHTLFACFDVRNDRDTTGLEDLLDNEFGIGLRLNYEVVAPVALPGAGFVVIQMSPNFQVRGDAYADHPAVSALRANAGLAVWFRGTTYLDLREKPPEGVTLEAACYAPAMPSQNKTPYALRLSPHRRDPSPDKDTDKLSGRFPLVATASKEVPSADGKESRRMRVIVSADTDVFTDDVTQQWPQNLDLARGLVQWGLNREGLVAVSEKTIEEMVVEPTEHQQRVAFWWPLGVAFLPLIGGGMVWWSRRR